MPKRRLPFINLYLEGSLLKLFVLKILQALNFQ